MALLDLGSWSPWHLWVLGAFFVIILEMLTSGFVLGCLAVGCFGAALVDLLGAHSLQPQVWVCAVVTFLSFFLLRPLVMRTMVHSDDATNTDFLVGHETTIVEVDPSDQVALAKVNGELWRIQSQNAHTLRVGETVRVVGVAGNRLLVVPKASASTPAS